MLLLMTRPPLLTTLPLFIGNVFLTYDNLMCFVRIS